MTYTLQLKIIKLKVQNSQIWGLSLPLLQYAFSDLQAFDLVDLSHFCSNLVPICVSVGENCLSSIEIRSNCKKNFMHVEMITHCHCMGWEEHVKQMLFLSKQNKSFFIKVSRTVD